MIIISRMLQPISSIIYILFLPIIVALSYEYFILDYQIIQKFKLIDKIELFIFIISTPPIEVAEYKFYFKLIFILSFKSLSIH